MITSSNPRDHRRSDFFRYPSIFLLPVFQGGDAERVRSHITGYVHVVGEMWRKICSFPFAPPPPTYLLLQVTFFKKDFRKRMRAYPDESATFHWCLVFRDEDIGHISSRYTKDDNLIHSEILWSTSIIDVSDIRLHLTPEVIHDIQNRFNTLSKALELE